MSLKSIVSAQYKGLVDQAAGTRGVFKVPHEGWIRTVRKALGMSVSQLAARLSVTRSLISRTEKEELHGAVTLKTMQKMAQAMGCHFIYAIVPEQNIDNLIYEQAKMKAKEIVAKTNVQMALEDQLLSEDKIQFGIERLTQEIIKENRYDLWDNGWSLKK